MWDSESTWEILQVESKPLEVLSRFFFRVTLAAGWRVAGRVRGEEGAALVVWARGDGEPNSACTWLGESSVQDLFQAPLTQWRVY